MLVFKEWMATKDGVAKLQVMSNQVRSTTIYFSHFSGVPNYQFINLLGMLVLIFTKQVKSEQRTRGVPDCQCFLLFYCQGCQGARFWVINTMSQKLALRFSRVPDYKFWIYWSNTNHTIVGVVNYLSSGCQDLIVRGARLSVFPFWREIYYLFTAHAWRYKSFSDSR